MMMLFFGFGETSLYYFLSTMAQVLAAAMAIIAVFVQFRINHLSGFLIGDGKTLLKRWSSYRNKYNATDTYKGRLSDPIDRESLQGVNKIVDYLAKKEKEAGITLEDEPRGLQYAQKRFNATRHDIQELIALSKKAFKWSLITAVFSTSSILFINLLSLFKIATLFVTGINLLLLIWCTVLLWRGLQKGLEDPAIRNNEDWAG